MELWALVSLFQLPLRVINGHGRELVRTSPRRVWTLRVHDRHYTIVTPLWHAPPHTRNVRMELLRCQPVLPDPLRGAGKQAKGHLPWESTSTTVGLKLLTKVTVGAGESRGCALVLLATLMQNKDLETTEPTVLMFPGN
eukprot:6456898-Amphidinium_carterae.1